MTTNKLKIQRDLNKLHPFCKKQVLKVLEDCKKEGLKVDVFETLRTLERQKTLKSKGKSKTLNSYHRLGLAVDIVFKTEKGNWTWKKDNSEWDKLATIAEKHGFSSGWRWKTFKDGPHMELRFEGVNTRKLYRKLNSSKSRKEFYAYVDKLLQEDPKLSKLLDTPKKAKVISKNIKVPEKSKKPIKDDILEAAREGDRVNTFKKAIKDIEKENKKVKHIANLPKKPRNFILSFLISFFSFFKRNK